MGLYRLVGFLLAPSRPDRVHGTDRAGHVAALVGLGHENTTKTGRPCTPATATRLHRPPRFLASAALAAASCFCTRAGDPLGQTHELLGEPSDWKFPTDSRRNVICPERLLAARSWTRHPGCSVFSLCTSAHVSNEAVGTRGAVPAGQGDGDIGEADLAPTRGEGGGGRVG